MVNLPTARKWFGSAGEILHLTEYRRKAIASNRPANVSSGGLLSLHRCNFRTITLPFPYHQSIPHYRYLTQDAGNALLYLLRLEVLSRGTIVTISHSWHARAPVGLL
ncbi:hypothetical protein EVAR_96033_1 [Eumeta japonica]|uniref:Uncharacterized protein n=1 Tax=Eumeta variegata TaxID=151549 RepID=A0A4C1SKL8_EUMVA|nr:hypothetical protein EVAR_96033_1 [Eumeta japonica]